MFGISFEHLIILAIVLIIFGPRRLPELGNTLGKAIRNFKDGLAGVENGEYRRINTPPPAAGALPPHARTAPVDPDSVLAATAPNHHPSHATPGAPTATEPGADKKHDPSEK